MTNDKRKPGRSLVAWMYVNSDGECEEIGHVTHYDKKGNNPFTHNNEEMVRVGFVPLYDQPPGTAALKQPLEVITAAKAVVDRWETPLWKDATHTGEYIYKLRDAITSYEQCKRRKK